MRKILLPTLLLIAICSCLSMSAQTLPAIVEQPYNFNTCPGSKAYFTSSAYYQTYYRWIVTTDGGTTWDTVRDNASYFGATTPNLVVTTTAAFANYTYRLVAGNQYGAVLSNGATLYLTNSAPLSGYGSSGTSGPATFCQGSSPAITAWSYADYADTIIWSYTGTGLSFTHDLSSSQRNLYSGMYWDTIAQLHFDATATSGNLVMTPKNACGTGPAVTVAFTLTPQSSSLAGTAGGAAVCATYNVPAGGSTFSDAATCNPMATLIPSGSSPVTGNVKSCVTIDAAVQSYNGVPYVQRYYNIQPTANAAASTATLTLYYTQADFDSYNLARGTYPALPTGPTDAAGIANLRITQFHGTGTTPSTFTAGSGDIDPSDNNIVWNPTLNRWEITFDITGFSGFFVSGASLVTPLPLTLTAFTAKATANGNLIQWTTSTEENTATFGIQRSDNPSATGFSSIATLPAAGNSHQPIDYSYTDPNPGTAGPIFYRLKTNDLDGKFTYSKTVVVQPAATAVSLKILPNPSLQPQSISIHMQQKASATLTVTDLSGRQLITRPLTLSAGDNNLDASILDPLQKGFYLVTLHTDTQQLTVKFAKQ